jgi:hypothetical protein
MTSSSWVKTWTIVRGPRKNIHVGSQKTRQLSLVCWTEKAANHEVLGWLSFGYTYFYQLFKFIIICLAPLDSFQGSAVC